MRASLIAASLLLAGCVTAQPTSEAPHPFVGCWDSANGLSREGWTIDPSGWLVGYSATRDAAGEVVFFEFMRVERGDGPDVLVVSSADGATTRFTYDPSSAAGDIRFTNSQHDYPQAITYKPSAGRLDAEISLMDGSKVVSFPKVACVE